MSDESPTGDESDCAEETCAMPVLNEENLRMLIDNIQVGVVLIDAETHEIVDINAKAEEMIGCPRSDILGNECHEFICQAKRGQCPVTDLGQTVDNTENILIKRSGEQVPVLKTVRRITIGGRMYLLGSFVDLTEHKATQIALRESEEQFKSIFESSRDGIMLADPESHRFIMVNPAIEKLLGYSHEELMSMGLADIHPAEDLPLAIETFRRQLAGDIELAEGMRVLRKDGTVIYCDINSILRKFGNRDLLMGVFRDVTEKKWMLDALKSEKEKAENYLKLAGVMLVALDRDENIALINPKVHEILETDGANLVGMNWFDNFIPPENRDSVRTVFNRIMAGDVAPEERYENAVVTSKGNRRMIAWHNSVMKDERGQVIGLLSSGEDITEQMTYRDALRESEERFKILSNLTFEGIVLHDMGLVMDANESFLRMFGYAREEIIGKKVIPLLIQPEYHETIRENMARNYANPYEVMGRRKDGSVFPLEMEARNFEIDGKNVRVVATRDISERKKAEEDIRASEAKYRLLSDNSSDVIWSIDLDGKFQYVSPSVQKLRGFTAEEAMAQRADETLMPEGVKLFERELARILGVLGTGGELKQNRIFELEQPCKDGTTVWTEVSASIMFDENGEPVGIQGVSRDITERRKMESLLKESEKKFRTMMNSSADAVFITDRRGDYTYVNPAAEKMMGYDSEELMEMNIADILRKEDVEKSLNAFQQLLESGKLFMGLVLVRKDGGTVPTELNAVVMDNGDIYGSCRDITERKIAENALKTIQNQLAEAMDMAQLVNWEFDVTTGMFTFDDRFYALYGTTAELEGGHRMSADVYAQKYVHPEDKGVVGNEVNKAIQASDPDYTSQVEHRIIRRDGEVRHIIVRLGIIKDKNGRTIKARGANQDITERKKMEETMKNNLQDLERYKKATIDRELKMVELKEEMRSLKEKQRGG